MYTVINNTLMQNKIVTQSHIEWVIILCMWRKKMKAMKGVQKNYLHQLTKHPFL